MEVLDPTDKIFIMKILVVSVSINNSYNDSNQYKNNKGVSWQQFFTKNIDKCT